MQADVHWGFNVIDGVPFFLEEGRELPALCPIKHTPSFSCPHKTSSDIIPEQRKKELVFVKGGNFKWKEGVEVKDSVILYTGIRCIRQIKKLLNITNYTPLLVKGVYMDGKQDEFFRLLYNEWVCGIRTVVLIGDDMIPLPSFIERRLNYD